MAIRFDLEIYGDKLVSRELTRFGDRALDARPAFASIADQLRSAERLRFATRGNGTWSHLADSTIQVKARKRLDPRVLQATHRLRNSLTEGKGRHAGNEDQELIITPGFMVFGTKVPYAQFHQRGEGVPVRKPVGLRERAKRDVLRTLQHYIVTGDA